jgi:GNAT superfamily N-acetyltransferase
VNTTKKTITSRFATLDDVTAIAPLLDSYRQFYGELSQMKQSQDFLQERLLLGESHVIVAEMEGKIVGFTQLFPSFSTVSLQRLWILNDLYVEVEKRGLGIGHLLLETAAKFGRQSGAKQLFIEGAVNNTSACSLYEKFGFIHNSEYHYYHLPLHQKHNKN